MTSLTKDSRRGAAAVASVAVAVLFLVFTGCGDTVTEVSFPDTEPRLTVTSYFNPDSTWRVRVSQSSSLAENRRGRQLGGVEPLPPVGNATVQILRSGQVVDTLRNIDLDSPLYADYDGTYGTAFTPTAGASYTLRVEAPGFDPVTAESAVPAPIPVTHASFSDSVYIYQPDSANPEPVSQFTFRFTDPPGERNYYRVVLYPRRNDVTRGFAPIDVFTINAEIDRDLFADPGTFASGDWVEEFPFRRSVVFTDNAFDGQEYELTVSVPISRSYLYGYEAVLSTISEEYYKYRQSVWLQEVTAKNPFAEPVTIQSNVEGGFGIFGGARSMASTLVVLDSSAAW